MPVPACCRSHGHGATIDQLPALVASWRRVAIQELGNRQQFFRRRIRHRIILKALLRDKEYHWASLLASCRLAETAGRGREHVKEVCSGLAATIAISRGSDLTACSRSVPHDQH
jgi:hypothetical protein